MPTTEKTEAYRIAVTRRNVSEFLAIPKESGLEFPTVQVAQNRRLAQQLTAEIDRRWKLQTYCLRISNSHCKDEDLGSFAVMECAHPDAVSLNGAQWTSLSDCRTRLEVGNESNAIFHKIIGELKCSSQNASAGPFTQPGWFRTLLLWVREQLDMLGLRPTGNFSQWNASPTFSLVRIETTGPAVWFKATGEPNQRELPISVAIARLLPAYAPLILGIYPEWNGWLTGELPGESLSETFDPSDWERVASTLARMQMESISAIDSLVEAGCKDLRTAKLSAQIGPFLRRMAILMNEQEKKTPAPLKSQQLDLIESQLTEAISQFTQIGLPDALTHIDFNPGNILLSTERCSFLDWAEGGVSSPLVTFEFLREHFSRRNIGSERRLREAYLRPWMSLLSEKQIVTGMKFSPLVAVFAYAAQDLNWETDEVHQIEHHAAYYRALTRRMYLEAVRISEIGVPCLD